MDCGAVWQGANRTHVIVPPGTRHVARPAQIPGCARAPAQDSIIKLRHNFLLPVLRWSHAGRRWRRAKQVVNIPKTTPWTRPGHVPEQDMDAALVECRMNDSSR